MEIWKSAEGLENWSDHRNKQMGVQKTIVPYLSFFPEKCILNASKRYRAITDSKLQGTQCRHQPRCGTASQLYSLQQIFESPGNAQKCLCLLRGPQKVQHRILCKNFPGDLQVAYCMIVYLSHKTGLD